jgi:probable rRNA maturation factor
MTNAMDDEPSSSTRASGTQANTISVDILDDEHALDPSARAWIASAVRRVCAQLPNSGEIRVSIINDQRMRQQHNKYSGLDTTTDVLTFDLASDQAPNSSKVLDADLFVCADEAQRQAQSRKHDTKHELLLYIVHGVLHCIGYDDHDEENYQRMHAREDELLSAAGFGALFHSSTENNS